MVIKMSADAWECCQICHNLPKEWRNGINNLYGKISHKEYSDIEKKYNNLKSMKVVRQNYECGLNYDGTAYVSFYFKCETCGAEWKYSANDIKHKRG